MTTAEYNKCVEQHADGLYRFIVKNKKDEDDARDVVQNAFETLWRNIDKVEVGKAKSYLFTVAYHNMIDMIRREKFKTELKPHHENRGTAGRSYKGLKEVIQNALDKLTDVQRTVLLLRDYEGYSYAEIGDITQLTEAQVKVYIFRARQAMRELIGELENVI